MTNPPDMRLDGGQPEQPVVTITYGHTIRWTTGWLDEATVISTSGHNTHAEAVSRAIDFAKAAGWTPAKWWQWWRWNDTKINK